MIFALNFAVRNDGDFVDVILLHFSFQHQRYLSGLLIAQRRYTYLALEGDCIQLLPGMCVCVLSLSERCGCLAF